MGSQLLTNEEVASYHERGFFVPAWRLPDDLIDGMRQAIERLMQDNPDVRPEQLVGAHVPVSKDSGVRGRAELRELAQDRRILDVVEQLIGPDIIIWGSQVFSKPGGDGMAIPWHQDGQYWPMRPLATVTVWVAIDPATVENGCLRVVPGTHRGGLLAHQEDNAGGLALNQGLAPGAFDERTAVDIELQAGQFSLHHAMLVHGSNANTSGQRRCGYAIRYMPATSLFDRSIPPTRIANNQVIDFSQRPIWLVRGQDRAGNDFRPGRDDL